MSENIEKAPNVPPFVTFVTSAVPMVFDNSMSYYEALCALWKYMQDSVVNVINNNATVTEEYIQMTNDMKSYMDNYFDNLDVQEEINKKLDDLVADGTLSDLLNDQLAEFTANINTEIDNFEVSVGNQIDIINSKVNAVIGITPTVVATTDDMTDTSKIYVVVATNKWYYYDNDQWNEGGDYNSDAGVSLIEWYLSNITLTNGNPLDPTACKDNTGLVTGTGGEVENASFWVTDYLATTETVVGTNTYLGSVLNIKNFGNGAYKVMLYDTNKDVLGQGSILYNMSFLKQAGTTGTVAYVRIQFQKTSVPFDNRKDIVFSSAQYVGRKVKTYYNIPETSIKDCGTSIFKDDIDNVLASELLAKGVFPFTINDFSFGTIATSDGAKTPSNTRTLIDKPILYKHGLKITLTNGWTMLAMQYSKNDVYMGRYASSWASTLTINNDVYLRLLFQKNSGNIASTASIEELLNNITITSFSNPNTYLGEKISLNNTFDSVQTNISGLGQDGASYGDIVLFCSTEGRYKIYDISSEVIKQESYLSEYTTLQPHFNSLCFGTERFNESDIYPMFYGNAYNNTSLPKGALYAYRLKDDLTTEFKQTIVVGFTDQSIWNGNGTNVRDYGNFVIDTDNNYLYAFTMIDSLQVTRFFKFEMPTIADGSTVTLTTDDIVDMFNVPYESYIQGCCYHNGKIYSLSGFGNESSPALMHVIDLATEKEVSTVPLGEIEPEAVFVSKNKLYTGQINIFQYNFD